MWRKKWTATGKVNEEKNDSNMGGVQKKLNINMKSVQKKLTGKEKVGQKS
jgi:hypothetical protein